ncbi:ATPase domain protein [Aggregatibacter actinomycetemcomitans serotype e str. SC1083]|uniref:ATPase domain protein n=2 Tax=Aggregatibacter actinomycetemcomitans TaxID=714 RepID=G4A5J4_AGGAC|nr:ATPase domain protein [Aggregatibacter actinomycetemcomitans serotype e str. SC1083]
MIAEADGAIESENFLDYPESGLLSLVLADRESDIRQIGNAVEIKFNDEQNFDDKTPLIVFAETAEAELNGKHLAEQFKRAVQSHFKEMLKRPELLGRIGEANIIPFNFMQDTDVLKAIARAKLKPLEGRLKEKWGIEKLMFENEDKALDTLVKQVNQQHGGRGVLNVLTKYLFDPLAEFLFDQVEQPNKLKGKTLKVLQAGRHFDFELE